jgi:hypothetical protein
MWAMFSNSLKLLLKGKLFREPSMALRQWLIGFAASVGLVVVLAKAGAALWLAVTVAALVAGALQPLLFKNLKYA